MKLIREVVGFGLVFLAWFNPFTIEPMIRILIFLLGFDAMSIIPKIGVFAIDYLFGFRWLGWTLLVMVAAEAIFAIIPFGKKIIIIVKALAVFSVSFLAFDLQPALIVTGIDLLLNIGIWK